MANEMEHKLKAEHNFKLLSKIERIDNASEFIDWMYVILYYSALHFGDAYLAKKGITSIKNHDDRRKNYSQKLPENVFVLYKKLENRSIIARYHPEMAHVLTESEFRSIYINDFHIIQSLV